MQKAFFECLWPQERLFLEFMRRYTPKIAYEKQAPALFV
jgi:hypothetical protein